MNERLASRTVLLTLLLGTFACTRATEKPQPKAVAEPSVDASTAMTTPKALSDAGPTKAEPPSSSPFSIAVRVPSGFRRPYARDIAGGVAHVQRLPNGGLVVASEYARAKADGAGPLTVELLGRGAIEQGVLNRATIVQGMEAMRWVWTDATTSILVFEEETGRSGPRLTSYKLGANGFEAMRPHVGYWSAVMRGGSILALERTAFEIPNSSAYPKGSGYEQNSWSLKPARVAVLSGSGPAPVIPAGVCATAMSAASDGALAITVEKCDEQIDKHHAGVLRYAPGATQSKIEWFAERKQDGQEPEDVTPVVASANEIYIADGSHLQTWNGREWSDATPFASDPFYSLSRAPNGELWGTLKSGRLVKRAPDGAAWTALGLPPAPEDRLDPEVYAAPTFEVSHFVKVSEPPEEQSLRAIGSASLTALSVDATQDEIIVLAQAEREGFVLSTKVRSPIARIPSVFVQRAKLAQTLRRRVASSPTDCRTSFLSFPDGTKPDAIRAGLSGLGDAGATAKVGESIVEGQKRVVLYGESEAMIAGQKKFASLAPKRLCGPAVIDRDL